MLGGYDLRGLQCDLQEFAPATIGGKPVVPFVWKGANIVCWNGEVQCPPEMDFKVMEEALSQYSCQLSNFHCTSTSLCWFR